MKWPNAFNDAGMAETENILSLKKPTDTLAYFHFSKCPLEFPLFQCPFLNVHFAMLCIKIQSIQLVVVCLVKERQTESNLLGLAF